MRKKLYRWALVAWVGTAAACATPNQKLIRSIREGDQAQADQLLGQGAEVNAKVDDRMFWLDCPLHAAVRSGRLELARWLVGKGADVSLPCAYDETPLHLAVRQGDLELGRFLLDKGARVNARSSLGRTPLQVAAFENRPDWAALLLGAGADVANEDDEGMTALGDAVYPEDRASTAFKPAEGLGQVKLDLARLLCGKGADAGRPNKNGLTPLALALCSENHSGAAPVAAFLLDRGALLEAVDVEKLPRHCHLGFELAQEIQKRPDGEAFLAKLENRAEALRRQYEAGLAAERLERAQAAAAQTVHTMGAGSDCGYGVCPVGETCVGVVNSAGGIIYHACRSGAYLYNTR